MTKLRVEVTAEDIDRGLRNSRCWCPVARAIKRALAGPDHGPLIPDAAVLVSGSQVEIYDGRADLPPEAVAFIRAFDRHEPCRPFSFEI